MNEKILLGFEFGGRGLIATISILVIYNMAGIWIAWLALIIMILWMLNPLFEYKLYGGN